LPCFGAVAAGIGGVTATGGLARCAPVVDFDWAGFDEVADFTGCAATGGAVSDERPGPGGGALGDGDAADGDATEDDAPGGDCELSGGAAACSAVGGALVDGAFIKPQPGTERTTTQPAIIHRPARLFIGEFGTARPCLSVASGERYDFMAAPRAPY
jgi:hypothetical protein